MKHYVLISLVIFVVASCSYNKGTVLEIEMPSYQIEQQFKQNEPGVQYIVVDTNSTIYERSVGLSDIAGKKKMTADHTMPAFSMTKTLTAIAVLQLVEQNKVALNDRLDKYIEHPYGSELTIRHLLNHTSGIPNPIPLKWVHLAVDHDEFNERIVFERILNQHSKLDTQPGSKYQYSNIGYWLLGSLIENVSGTEYTKYVSENIFAPLDLTSDEISFQIVDSNKYAKGYLKKWSLMNIYSRFFVDSSVLGNYEASWLHINNVYLNGPSFGGAIGTARAFSRILQNFLSEKPKLLEIETRQFLYAQQKNSDDEDIEMTLGWHIGELNGDFYYYKEGGGAGFHSEMRIYPKKGIASVLMTNRTSLNSKKMLSRLDVSFVGY